MADKIIIDSSLMKIRDFIEINCKVKYNHNVYKRVLKFLQDINASGIKCIVKIGGDWYVNTLLIKNIGKTIFGNEEDYSDIEKSIMEMRRNINLLTKENQLLRERVDFLELKSNKKS